jgi:hypothetical protein
MVGTTAPARPLLWIGTSKAVHASPFPSEPKLRPTLSLDTLARIDEDTQVLAKTALIGFTPMKHPSVPSRIEL